MVGEFSGPSVDGAALKFNSVTPFEALALAIVRKVIAKFNAYDLADELWSAEGARVAGNGSRPGDRGLLFVGFEGELGDAGDAPVDFAARGFEFAVLAAFDLAVSLRVGLDLIGDELFDDNAFDPSGEELISGAAGALSLFSFYVVLLWS